VTRRSALGVGCLIMAIACGLPACAPFAPIGTWIKDRRCAGNVVTTTDGVQRDVKQNTSSAAARYGWKLIAHDEFQGPCLSTAWKVYDSPDAYGVAIRRPQAVSLADGQLKITSRRNVTGGLAWRGDRLYGRWEVRARSERGRGYSQVLLLWPKSQNWPQDGEIDFSEVAESDRKEDAFSVHYGAGNDQVRTMISGDFTQWHDYAVEWEPDHVTVYVDGEPVFTTVNAAAIPRTPMHLCIQQDVGPLPGGLPPPDASTPAAVTMHVAWVRAYA